MRAGSYESKAKETDSWQRKFIACSDVADLFDIAIIFGFGTPFSGNRSFKTLEILNSDRPVTAEAV